MPATGRLRIASYNIEWFDALFDREGAARADQAWSSRHNVTRAQQSEAIAKVLRALDADGIMVIEAPDNAPDGRTIAALEGFAERADLRAKTAMLGFTNGTQQEIAFLYDPDVLSVRHAPSEAGAPRFDGTLTLDLDIDARGDPIVWSKPPLEIEVDSPAGRLNLIGVHAKSKAPHGAKDEADAMRISIANRRKQLAQCIWLRRRVEARLEVGDSVIVMGDFNDGPGLDRFEKLFGRSGVEIVLGEEDEVQLYDPSAAQALQSRLSAAPTSARFWISREKRYLQALLDYIMVSPDIRETAPSWRIWHPLEDLECCEDPALQQALLAASDHFPVTLDLAITP